MEWAATLKEYEKLVIRMNTPRVVIDNTVCATATLVKVASGRKHGILLEAVQVLTDLNLCIKKAYISSDGQWFMDSGSWSFSSRMGCLIMRRSCFRSQSCLVMYTPSMILFLLRVLLMIMRPVCGTW